MRYPCAYSWRYSTRSCPGIRVPSAASLAPGELQLRLQAYCRSLRCFDQTRSLVSSARHRSCYEGQVYNVVTKWTSLYCCGIWHTRFTNKIDLKLLLQPSQLNSCLRGAMPKQWVGSESSVLCGVGWQRSVSSCYAPRSDGQAKIYACQHMGFLDMHCLRDRGVYRRRGEEAKRWIINVEWDQSSRTSHRLQSPTVGSGSQEDEQVCLDAFTDMVKNGPQRHLCCGFLCPSPYCLPCLSNNDRTLRG